MKSRTEESLCPIPPSAEVPSVTRFEIASIGERESAEER
jgi:hypothetical protein